MGLRDDYEERFALLEQIKEEIKIRLIEIFDEVPRVDGISVRVKSIDKFLEKAGKIYGENDKPVYDYPLEEIQDQIGARVIVFYKSDVRLATERILADFREVENTQKEYPDPEGFSYEARHLICFLPEDVVTKHNPPIDFFELQICTLFQHAWSEANHDLGYKPAEVLSFDDRRRIAWAAAQAWGADIIFDELWNKNQKNN